jgi:hypothetical protein
MFMFAVLPYLQVMEHQRQLLEQQQEVLRLAVGQLCKQLPQAQPTQQH